MGLKIGEKELSIPLIQGGMGVGISLGGLAGAVAACGGVGTISSAYIGFRQKNFFTDTAAANEAAIIEEVSKAKKISQGSGMIAVNIMVAMTEYAAAVKGAVKAGADAIVSGAGLPKNLPEYTKDSDVLIAPIVSSGRAARIICQLWDKHYSVAPDFVIIEGQKAGGHLGFSSDDLLNNKCEDLETIFADVKKNIVKYEEKYQRQIPVIVAGGIRTADEVKHFLDLGVDGVQLATSFIATHECDATDDFKKVILEASNEDIRIIKSPVGMPGRALNTPLIQYVAEHGRIAPKTCRKCIKTCNAADTVYCISNALISAYYGDYENGLFFCGADVDSLKELRTVQEVINEVINYSK